MTNHQGQLEKSTRTDLLYGLALKDCAEVATLASPRTADAAEHAASSNAPGDAPSDSDKIRQLAATRADSSLTAQVRVDGPAGEEAKRARRWRYPEGCVLPEREPSITWEAYAVADRPTPWTLGRLFRHAWRASQAWWISFGVHVVILPLLALLSVAASHDAWQVACEIVTSPPRPEMQVLNIPPPAALPTPLEYARVQAVTMEVSVPEVEIERGAMPGRFTEQALLVQSDTFVPFPEIDDLFGHGGERGKAFVGDTGAGAQFFGLPASGNKFVFVVDCSLSMQDDGRWLEACQELDAAIARLGPQQLFYVILFDGAVHRMFNHDERQAALFPATDDNKARFREWLMTARLGFETRPFLSVKNAIDLRPDAVYLLSDGDFKDPTAEYLKRYNLPYDHQGHPLHQVVVHTIVFHSRDGLDTMRRIARENGGKTLFIRKF